MNVQRTAIPLFLTVLLALTAHAADPTEDLRVKAKDEKGSLEHDGKRRRYTVHTPPNFNTTAQHALVIALHGATQTSNSFSQMINLNDVSDRAGFVVVYPQGLKTKYHGEDSTHWNSHFGTGVDDLGFLRALIQKLITNYNVNPSRVYAAGYSDGGMMSFMLACQLSESIAAVAVVGALLPIAQLSDCNPVFKLPVMGIHGTEDKFAPIDGYPGYTLSFENSMRIFARAYGCNMDPLPESVADINNRDRSTVSHRRFEDCGTSTSVEYFQIEGGGHTWPSSSGGIYAEQFLGPINKDLNGSKVIWSFFEQYTHPKPRI